MNSLRIENGYHLTILRDCGDYNDRVCTSFDEYPTEFYEKSIRCNQNSRKT